jgi:hypothetical protein
MEELATEMVLLERSSGTKLRIGIWFGSVILAGQVPSSTCFNYQSSGATVAGLWRLAVRVTFPDEWIEKKKQKVA